MATTPRETDTAGTLALTSPQHSLLVSPRSAWKRCMQDAEDIDAKVYIHPLTVTAIRTASSTTHTNCPGANPPLEVVALATERDHNAPPPRTVALLGHRLRARRC